MSRSRSLPPRPLPTARPSLPFLLLAALLCVLWLAGGASRADALGQVVVRVAAWSALVVMIVFGKRTGIGSARPVLLLCLAAAGLAAIQLVPLPPMLWQALPGRAMFTDAAVGAAQPWRPWSIVPGATANALFSLIVPFATLALLVQLPETDRLRTVSLCLGIVAASMGIGLLQAIGGGFNNPLVNDTLGQVSGTFANRNHFALFMAFGCLLAPVWAFGDHHAPRWRALVALALVLLFGLTILSAGSRAGIGLGLLAVALAVAISGRAIRRIFARAPRWVFPATMAAVLGTIAIFVLVSIVAGRAISIERALALDPGQDMRSRGFPTVIAMIREYLPFGSGLGGFDPVFRIHEADGLLKPTYFNHAHNDFLEIVLDAGIPGLIVLGLGLAWLSAASVQAWRTTKAAGMRANGGDYGEGFEVTLPRLGSAMLLLVAVASAFDYPARTPMMMAIMTIAATWLAAGRQSQGSTPS